jgi:chromosome segregation ATPase
MKRMAVIVAVTGVLFAGCTPKKKTDEGDKGSTGPAPMADMGGMTPAASTAAETAADTAEFSRILEKNKALARTMQSIKTLDDLKRTRPDYVKINIDILKLTIASLKKAVHLSPKRLRNYVAKYIEMNKANADFGKKLVQIQKRVMQLEGAKAYIAQTQKALAQKLKPLTTQMRELASQYMKKMKAMMQAAAQKQASGSPGAP